MSERMTFEDLRQAFIERLRKQEILLVSGSCDQKEVAALCHLLAGSAGFFGLSEVCETAKQYEKAIRTQLGPEECRAHERALLAAMRRTIDASHR